jgi:hypothetical protein
MFSRFGSHSAEGLPVRISTGRLPRTLLSSHTSSFIEEFFTKSNMTVVPHPAHFSPFSRVKIKLKGRHFIAVEVIEAESQVMMDTVTEHDFQSAFKQWQERWERCIHTEGDGGQ